MTGALKILTSLFNLSRNPHSYLTSVLHFPQSETLDCTSCRLCYVSQQIRAIAVNQNMQRYGEQHERCRHPVTFLADRSSPCGRPTLQVRVGIGREMKNDLPADRRTQSGIWTSCQVVGASSYEEIVNLTQERAEKLILTLLN